MNDESAPAEQQGQALQNKPVILNIIPSLETGGVERSVIELNQAIGVAGWSSFVASSGGYLVREITKAKGEHIILPMDSKNPLIMWKNIGRLQAVIREHKVSLIHVHSRAPAWSAYYAAKRENIPFITTFHGAYNLGMTRLKRLYNSVMTKGDSLIAVSGFIAEHMRENYKIEDKEIHVIYPGADIERFSPHKVSVERMIQLTQKWRIPEGIPVILVPGRLSRIKGQNIVIESLAKMKNMDVRCILVGSDQGRTRFSEALVEQIHRSNLEGVVQMVGECHDMPAAYMIANVVVGASLVPEAFGRVVVEAQSMGRPIIASNLGGPKETVLAEQTGKLVAPGDVDDMVSALKWGLELSEDDRSALSLQAQSHIKSGFTKEVCVDKTLKLYQEVLGQNDNKDS